MIQDTTVKSAQEVSWIISDYSLVATLKVWYSKLYTYVELATLFDIVIFEFYQKFTHDILQMGRVAQCGKNIIFLSVRIYVKSISGSLKGSVT